MTYAEFLALSAEERAAHLATLDADGLAALEAELVAHFAEVRQTPPTVERNADLTAITEALTETRTVADEQAAEVARLDAEAAALEATILPAEEPEEVPEPEAEDETPEEPEAPAEPEAVTTPEPVAPVAETPASVADPEPARVAAARRRPPMPTAAHRPPSGAPVARTHDRELRLVGPDDRVYASMGEVATELHRRRRNFGPVAPGTSDKVGVLRVHTQYPPERVIPDGASPEQVRELLAAATAERVRAGTETPLTELVAAGGYCAPSGTYNALPVLGDDVRVWRAGLTPFQIPGKVRFRRTPTLADIRAAGGVGDWTEQNDIDAVDADGPRKTGSRIDCPEILEVTAEATYHDLTVGNFLLLTDMALVEAWTNLTMIDFASHAESKIATAVGADSVQVNTDRVLGFTRDLLANIELAAVRLRGEHRMSRTAPVEWWGPEWSQALIRIDMARQMPGDGLGTMSITFEQILGWFRDRNIIPTFFRDGEEGQNLEGQTDGTLLTLPDRLIHYMWLPGTWVLGEAGVLELGLQRDSVTTASNDAKLFGEEFVVPFRPGPKSLRLDSPTCATGTASGTEDIVDLICPAS